MSSRPAMSMPDIVHSTVHAVSSSWAIATTPQPQNIWKDGALIWENSKDYLYARTTRAGRIIIGGEDSDEMIEPDARDRLIPEKSRLLAQKLAALWPVANTDIEFRWSGTFDTTSDGLPLIGPVPGAKGVYAAYGYGGNGITFSFLAAHLIGDLIAGATSPLLRDFALDRDGGKHRLKHNRPRKMAMEMARVGLETPVFSKRLTDAIFPAHDHPDRVCRRGGCCFFTPIFIGRIGPDRRKTHDHSFRFADHRQQGRHRRLAEDRPDLRHALHRLAL